VLEFIEQLQIGLLHMEEIKTTAVHAFCSLFLPCESPAEDK